MSKKQIRTALFIILDTISVFAALYISLGLRINFNSISAEDKNNLLVTAAYMVVITLGIYIALKLYNTMWEYASIDELIKIVLANVGIMIIVFIINSIFSINFPRSLYPISIMMLTLLTGGSRFSYRVLRHLKSLYLQQINKGSLIKTILIGSDEGVVSIIKSLKTTENKYLVPVAIVDNNRGRLGTTIENVPILGTLDDLEEIIINKEAGLVLLTGNQIKNKDLTGILNVCQRLGCDLKKYDRVTVSKDKRNIVNIKTDDLLGREEVDLDLDGISEYLRSKDIFVIGGGGSIGSELVRQIAVFNPAKIVIIDIIENDAYMLYRELSRKYPNLDLNIEIGSIRDKERMDYLFSKYNPQIVFHTAAHKHVPLMETAPYEAIKNNVLGTINVAHCADKYKSEKVILISTDKAVNPTNVMGASKRIAEMVIQSYSEKSKTIFCAVRFGNVLDSSGSVIPIFKKQIEEGGPVTITDKEITRYFMTISEACRLVMQAGAFAGGGEIFILNMGEQVRILDLAENMIRMQGLEPGIDIEIKYVGLRDGEKLYEELMLSDEDIETHHDKIYVTRCEHKNLDYIKSKIKEMQDVSNDMLKIKEIISELVPEYKIQG